MLLTAADPAPVHVTNPDGASPFLLIGDHAGNLIPSALGDLGLPESERTRHIAWDIGIAALGARLAAALGATFVEQRYSRLVVDCNRAPGQVGLMPEVSDGTLVPANHDLSEEAVTARLAEIHEPYHRAIADNLERRRGRPTILVSLHSFTPVMQSVARPWHCGLLHDLGDASLVAPMLAALRRDPALVVGDNQPYAMAGLDYTVPRHAYPDLPYLEIEIRQDLLAEAAGIALWTGRIAGALAAVAG
jgi:predicted N-formylglutamate amidohydrolase